jgi:hypothetical protein
MNRTFSYIQSHKERVIGSVEQRTLAKKTDSIA